MRALYSTPIPVEALPCGSRSISTTRCPLWARAAARLMAVVVLPTPPFWLATARVMGWADPRAGCEAGFEVFVFFLDSDTPDIAYFQNGAARSAAGNMCDCHVPVALGIGQLIGGLLPLQKQRIAVICDKFFRSGEKLRQICQSARGDDRSRLHGGRFDSLVDDGCPATTGCAAGFAQKSGLASV